MLFRPASSSTGYRHQNYSYDIIVDNLYTRRDFRDFAGYPQTEHCCLRPLRGRHAYKGLPEVGPARLLASMLRNLGASTLRSIKTMPSFFFSFWSIKPAMLSASMLGDYSMSPSSTPSCFPHCSDLLGNQFLIMSLLDLFFFPSLIFLDHHTGHQLDVGYYSSEARTSINLSCSSCFVYSCATFEFLSLDSSA
jgi:hypothetical protein